ncbi:MAG: hypothetical protein ACI9Y1_002988 [Lentisphaeria bacterium]|jgi:hypothetical protein
MEPVETSFVSEALRNREADVIWRIVWRDRWLYVYVLLEMQSSIDPMMAVRLLTYIGLLYQDLHARGELTQSGRLPPVFPITIYNGSKKWTAATKLSDIIEPVPASMAQYQPQLEYFLLDEGQAAKEAKKAAPNLVSALINLENSNTPSELSDALGELVVWLQQESPDYRRLRRTFTVWLANSLLPARFPGVKLPGLKNLSEVKEMLAERVTEWTKQWEQQGIEKGIERGIEKASLGVAKNMLKEGIAVEVVARVTGLSLERIEQLKSGR